MGERLRYGVLCRGVEALFRLQHAHQREGRSLASEGVQPIRSHTCRDALDLNLPSLHHTTPLPQSPNIPHRDLVHASVALSAPGLIPTHRQPRHATAMLPFRWALTSPSRAPDRDSAHIIPQTSRPQVIRPLHSAIRQSSRR